MSETSLATALPGIPFVGFPKMARLSRDIVITEKIDGTNAQIYITDDGRFLVGSRTRWITPQDDNYGFAHWAHEHKDELLKLGPGQHFGEWWGAGIQRKYGIGEKRFSLFNVHRWAAPGAPLIVTPNVNPTLPPHSQVHVPDCCGVVPTLYRGDFQTHHIMEVLNDLWIKGSSAAPGFMNPEGIVIFHTAAGFCFKKTIKDDESPKSALPLAA